MRVIGSLYDGAVTTVRSGRGKTLAFEIKDGVHQGSCLSTLLFITVMDAVSEYVQHDVPWDMLYADTIPYSFNNVVDIRNVQQIHTEIEIK